MFDPLTICGVSFHCAAWEWFEAHPDAILAAWARAEFGGWNISYDFLTSAYAKSTVSERFDNDPTFASSDLQASLETNTDGPEFDDDLALSTDTICSLRADPSPSELGSYSAVLENGSFLYVGDEELTDDDAEGEVDPEFNSEPTNQASVSSPLLYRHTSAMSSSSSLADVPESGDESTESESESEVEILSLRGQTTSTRGEIIVPEELIGATFIIDD
jgi:hypothetical protein